MTNLLIAAVVSLMVARVPNAAHNLAHVSNPSASARASARTSDAVARAILDTSVIRMGGIAALRSVQRVRVESMTEWQRTSLDNRTHPVVLSYEWSTELRDYAKPAWRYTRRFLGANGWTEVVDLVVDSVAAMKNNGKWGAQNVAYVDERTEVFTFTPERLMVFAYDAADARALPDTLLQGARYARVRANINGFRTTLLFGKGDGLLARAEFRAAQPKDFGLAGWGEMDVSIRYSQWQRLREVPINVPMQLNIYRVGKPYKRVTIVGSTVNPEFIPDSLVMPDSLRRAFYALGNRAMFDLAVDSARIVNTNFATFATPGTPVGAVRLGGSWLFIEGGTAPMSMQRSVAFLTKNDAATPIAGAIVTIPGGQAGFISLTGFAKPVWVTGGAKPYVAAMLEGWKSGAHVRDAVNGSWMHVGTDSLRIDVIDLPDYPSTAVLYSPTLQWVYAAPATSPLMLEHIVSFAKQRGWRVQRVASARDIVGSALAQ